MVLVFPRVRERAKLVWCLSAIILRDLIYYRKNSYTDLLILKIKIQYYLLLAEIFYKQYQLIFHGNSTISAITSLEAKIVLWADKYGHISSFQEMEGHLAYRRRTGKWVILLKLRSKSMTKARKENYRVGLDYSFCSSFPCFFSAYTCYWLLTVFSCWESVHR